MGEESGLKKTPTLWEGEGLLIRQRLKFKGMQGNER
jgi:hypothetical protein